MRKEFLALGAGMVLSSACAGDERPPTSDPGTYESSFDPDGTGGGESEDRLTDDELRLIGLGLADDMVLSRYRGDLELTVDATGLDGAIVWSENGDTNLASLVNVWVDESTGSHWNALATVVSGGCSFRDIDELRDPRRVALASKDVLEGSDDQRRVDLSWNLGPDFSDENEVGIVIYPFTYSSHPLVDPVDVHGATLYPILGCVEDGDLTLLTELAVD